MKNSTRILRQTPGSLAMLVGVGLGLGLGLAAPLAALAQDARDAGSAGPIEASAPAPAAAPLQFEIGPNIARTTWEETADRPAVGDAAILGLSVESVVGPYFGIRLDLGYATPEFTPGPADAGAAPLEAHQYSVDVSLVGRLGIRPLREAGVIPFATVGLGSVIHDPEPEGLLTRSQSAWEYGAGVDLPLLERFGARLEWRRADVSLENIFDEGADRTGRTVSNDRFTLGAYVRL